MQTWQMQNKSHVHFTGNCNALSPCKVIPVKPQIHANVVLIFIFYFFFFVPLFIHVSDIVLFLKFLLGTHSLIKYVHIVNAELIESTLKQTIMCLCFDDFVIALEI
jgi:hypothetical protein